MFGFNEYSSPLLVGVVPALVHAILLLVRWWREERWNDLFAAGILLVGVLYVSQWMLGFAGWYNDQDWRPTVMFYVLWDQLIVLGPLVYLYFRAATNTDFRWQRKHWWHIIPWMVYVLPFIIVTAYDWIIYRWVGGNAFAGFNGTRGELMDWVHDVGGYPPVVLDIITRFVMVGYLLYTLRDYLRYRRYLKAEFSNTEQLALPGLGYLIGLLLLGCLATFAIEVTTLLNPESTFETAWNSYMAMAVLMIFAGIQFYATDSRLTRALRFDTAPAIMASSPTPAPASAPVKDAPEATAATANNDAQELAHWAKKLNRYLNDQAAHLNPELKLGDLADAVGTNTSVLSRVINTTYGQNFNDFINSRRCATFLEKVAAGEHERHTLLSLALDAGFNSKSTFNRAFRKEYGYSPGEAVRRAGVKS